MERTKKIVKISIFGIIVNLILVIFKAIIGLIVNSIASTLDALNNLTDAISSLVTIIGTKLAGKSPDKEHPFGHGRIEYFTTIIIAFLILIVGLSALKEAITKIIVKENASYSLVSLIVIAVAVLTKLIFGKYVKKKGLELNSNTLVASGEDALMDSFLSFGTLLAGIINYLFKLTIEGYIGIIIAIFIIRSALKMLKEPIDFIIGVRTDKELTDKIKSSVASYPEVLGVYDLALHNYGPTKSIGMLNIEVNAEMTAYDIHILTKKITTSLFDNFGIIMTIGIYASNNQKQASKIKNDVNNIITSYDAIKELHGFFIDEDNDDIYFDLIVDFKCKTRDQLKKEVITKLQEIYPQYNYHVIIDDDITD